MKIQSDNHTYYLNTFDRLVLPCLFLLFSLTAYTQANKGHATRKALELRTQKGYNYKIVNAKASSDSTLSVIRRYNKEGYRTATGVLKNEKLEALYVFEYNNDTSVISRIRYVGVDTIFDTKTKMKYDKFGNVVEEKVIDSVIDFDPRTKRKFNKNGQLVRSYTKFKGRKVRDVKYKYNEHGNQISYTKLVPTKVQYTLSYDRDNRHTHTHKVFKNGDKKLVYYSDYSLVNTLTRHYRNDSRNILGVAGYIKLSSKDILTIESVFEDCLLIKETQYLNGDLNAIKVYHYSKE